MEVEVTLDLAAAEAAVAFVRDLETGLPPGALARRWTAVVDSPAYPAWLKAASSDPATALARLRESVPGRSLPPEVPDAVRSVVSGFAGAAGHAADLTARLAQARSLPVAEAGRLAKAVLPPDCPLRARVYVLVSGDHQGMASDDGEVALDLLLIPPVPAARLLLPVLAHELHHVGAAWCRRRDPSSVVEPARGPGRALALRVLGRLRDEGVANAYFTPPDLGWLRGLADAGTLAAIGLSAEALRGLEQGVAEERARLPAFVDELDRALQSLLSGRESAEAATYARLISRSRPGLPHPVAHFLGAAMVNAIRGHAGEQAVIACLASLPRFIPAYQEAAPAAGLPRLRSETVAAIGRLWG